MGVRLATCANTGCGHCEQCICARGERCSALCHRPCQQKPVIQTLAAVQDDAPAPRPERYQLLGADCAPRQYVCSDLGPPLLPGEAYLDESLAGLPDPSDQVLISEGPRGQGIKNVSELRRISTLEEECPFNPSKLEKIRGLAQSYDHWRRIRGDGNCFYRAVIFGALEALLAAGDRRRWRQLLGVLERAHHDGEADRRAHERLLRHLRSWTSGSQLEKWVIEDDGIDKALIRACRRLVRTFLLERADELAPNGLSYSQLIDSRFRSVEDFCARVVDPMGEDAETPAVEVLPIQLGIGLRLWILDRCEQAELVSLDTPGIDGRIDVHVLFKPGHYDLLYPRDRLFQVATSSQQMSAAGLLVVQGSQGALAAQNLVAAAPPSMSSLPLPRRPTEVHLSARHVASLPSPVPILREEYSLPDGTNSTLEGMRSLGGLPRAPPHMSPPRPPMASTANLAVPTKVHGILPVDLGPAYSPTGAVALTPTLLAPTFTAVLPHASAPGLPYAQQPILPTALCSSPLKKVRESEGTPLRCIPVCGVVTCPQAFEGGPCNCGRPGANEPRVGSKAEGMPRWSGVLGCGYGIVFSISGFLQSGAASRSHFQ